MSAATDEPTTREKIPVVALRLFAEKGYEATSMRAIAEQLGITKPALYYHFESKEAIVRELLRDLQAEVAALVEWTEGKRVTTSLRREVLTRWSDIMQSHGLSLFRFMTANRHLVRDLHHDKHEGMEPLINRLIEVLTPAGASVQDQLRVRMALMSINMGGMAGVGIDAADEQILAAARNIALDLLP